MGDVKGGSGIDFNYSVKVIIYGSITTFPTHFHFTSFFSTYMCNKYL